MPVTFKRRRSLPFIYQRDATECGTTCLAMIFKQYGLYNLQPTLRKAGRVGAEGTSLFALSELAETFGFTSDGYQAAYDTLKDLPLPCIAHYRGNHFVVVYKVTETDVWIADPGYGKDKLTREEFEARWNGIVLTVEPTAEVFQNPDVAELVEAQRAKETYVRKEFYLSLLRPFKAVLWEILAASFVLQLLGLALPFFTQVIVDQVLVHQNRRLLFAILAGMVLIFLTQVALTYVRNILLTQFKVRFELDFFSKFFHHFIHLDQSYFDAHRREDFINRFQENLEIRDVLSPSVLQLFIEGVLVFNWLAVLFFYNVTLALIALGFVLFFVLAVVVYSPMLERLEDKIFHENVQTMGAFLDTLLGMTTVKLLALERLKFWEWKNKYKKALNKVLKAEQTQIVLQSTLRGAFFLSQVVVYWVGAFMAFGGALTIGQYIAFVTIFTAAMMALNNASSLWFLATELSVTFARLNDVFMQDRERTDLLDQHTEIDRPRIAFRGVSFAYPQSPDRPILQGIDLTIEPGEHVALVGRNGSGKTTLAKLLVKLYPDYAGRIEIGGVEMRNLHPQALRRKVAMLPQEVHLFTGTLKDNIRYGRPEATMEEIIEAARLADFHDFVKNLYLGYNYVVGEGGANLSGGQKLKVAFARLFLGRPEVIVLDEASSVLDPEAEQRIMRNVKRHFRGKTVISIAHRLHTVRDADRILVLDGGAVAEEGRHEELLAQRGLYHQFMQNYLDV